MNTITLAMKMMHLQLMTKKLTEIHIFPQCQNCYLIRYENNK